MDRIERRTWKSGGISLAPFGLSDNALDERRHGGSGFAAINFLHNPLFIPFNPMTAGRLLPLFLENLFRPFGQSGNDPAGSVYRPAAGAA